jgi:hypothetical protein
VIPLPDIKQLVIQEARYQNCDLDIALATIEAETGFVNKTGDSGNALGPGQVWPKHHIDCFQYAAKRFDLTLQSTNLSYLTNITLNNDHFAVAMSVYCIKQYWLNLHKDWRQFTLHYVGPKIPDSDYKRRYNIWIKYHNNSDASNSGETAAGGSIFGNTQLPGQDFNVNVPVTNFGVVKGSERYGNILYGRRYRVLVTNSGNTALDVSDLRCVFSCVKTMQPTPAFSTVTIFNLNAQTENSLLKEGSRIVIEAGYEGDQYGLIFDGDILQSIHDKEDGVTYKLIINSIDSDRFFANGLASFTLTKGQSLRQVAQEIASRAKNPAQINFISDEYRDTKLTRGKVIFGLASDYMRQLAKSRQADFYMENGKINIIQATDYNANEIVDLSADSGLIGIPTQTEYGISGKCLLNPRIKLNSLIHIDNSMIRVRMLQMGTNLSIRLDGDGIYRVIKVTYAGDTRGDDWYTEFECCTQEGLIPSMISTAAGNGSGTGIVQNMSYTSGSGNSNQPLAQSTITYAKGFMGSKYVWGGETPSGFDCSGFIRYVLSNSGISMPRTAAEQASKGIQISNSNLEPGDLVFFDTNGGLNQINHVGMYIGGGKFIHAANPKRGVIISEIYDPYYTRAYMTARRVF